MIECFKIPFETKLCASRATKYKTHWRKGINALKPYRCKICGMWHLGHNQRDRHYGLRKNKLH